MSAHFIKLMLGFSVLLAGILLIEWMMLGSDEDPSKTSINSSEHTMDTATLPEIKFVDKAPEMYADMVERPLFIDGRRPVVESEDEPVSEVAGKIEDITLMGVYTQDDQSVALVKVQDDNEQYAKKKLGDEISGWLLQRIEKDRVILERDGDEQTLLLRKPKLNKTETKRPGQRENPFRKAMKQRSEAQKNQDEKREQNEQ